MINRMVATIEQLIERGIVVKEYKKIDCWIRSAIKFTDENKNYKD